MTIQHVTVVVILTAITFAITNVDLSNKHSWMAVFLGKLLLWLLVVGSMIWALVTGGFFA